MHHLTPGRCTVSGQCTVSSALILHISGMHTATAQTIVYTQGRSTQSGHGRTGLKKLILLVRSNPGWFSITDIAYAMHRLQSYVWVVIHEVVTVYFLRYHYWLLNIIRDSEYFPGLCSAPHRGLTAPPPPDPQLFTTASGPTGLKPGGMAPTCQWYKPRSGCIHS